MSLPKKVLWFSRHDMAAKQLSDLARVYGDDIIVTKINGNMPNVHVPFMAKVNNADEVEVKAMKEMLKDFDVLAVVMPIHLKQQVIAVADGRPLIEAQNNRVLVKSEDGSEDKVEFVFDGWFEVKEIKVVRERL